MIFPAGEARQRTDVSDISLAKDILVDIRDWEVPMKKDMIRFISFICIFMSLFSWSVHASADDETYTSFTASITGTTFGNKADLPYTVRADFDLRWLTSCCTAQYNDGLATFSNLLSADIYTGAAVKRQPFSGTYDNKAFLSSFGFTDIEEANIGAGAAEDKLDTTFLITAHREAVIDGKGYDIFVCVIRGTDKGTGEWESNFDIGSTCTEYQVTGEHPDWTNSDNHKGFDVAATRAKKVIDGYLESIPLKEGYQRTMLLTGHSRGAAVANILGAAYEDDPGIRSYTYTFACPNTSVMESEKAASYNSIYNLINENDFISVMPLKEWGFRRYGTDITRDIYSDSTMKKALENIDRNTYRKADVGAIEKSFEAVSKDRDGMYRYVTETRSFKTREMQQIELHTLEDTVALLGAEKFTSLEASEKKDGNGVYTLKIIQCPAVYAMGLGRIMSQRSDTVKALSLAARLLALLPKGSPERKSMQVMYENIKGLAAPHEVAATYIMTKYVKGKREPLHAGGEATCVSRAVCRECGTEYGVTDPDNHIRRELMGARAATYIANGYSGDIVCSDCGKTVETGHTVRRLSQTDLAGLEYKLSFEEAEYTGEEIEPEISLFHLGRKVDPSLYTVAYEDNVDPGKAKAVITSVPGNNPYNGTLEVEFVILPRSPEPVPTSNAGPQKSPEKPQASRIPGSYRGEDGKEGTVYEKTDPMIIVYITAGIILVLLIGILFIASRNRAEVQDDEEDNEDKEAAEERLVLPRKQVIPENEMQYALKAVAYIKENSGKPVPAPWRVAEEDRKAFKKDRQAYYTGLAMRMRLICPDVDEEEEEDIREIVRSIINGRPEGLLTAAGLDYERAYRDTRAGKRKAPRDSYFERFLSYRIMTGLMNLKDTEKRQDKEN